MGVQSQVQSQAQSQVQPQAQSQVQQVQQPEKVQVQLSPQVSQQQLQDRVRELEQALELQQETVTSLTGENVELHFDFKALQDKFAATTAAMEKQQPELKKSKAKVAGLEKTLTAGAVRDATVRAAERRAEQVTRGDVEDNKKRLERLRGSHPRRARDMLWFELHRQ